MAHPYKDQANSSHKTKTGNMGKEANLVLPIMRAVGENSGKRISGSSSSMQHKDQSSASGMKRGGHVGKKRHSKPKTPIVIAAPEAPVAPPSPMPPVAAAGAGSSPAPAPMPPMKRGGRAYPLTAGSESGEGRLQKAHSQARKS